MPTTFTHLLEPDLQRLIDERAYRELRVSLSAMEPADIADMIETLPPESGVVAFRVLPREVSGETFAELNQQVQESLLQELGTERSARVIEMMDPDDRVALLDELPIEIATRLIAQFSPSNRRVTQAILGYPADSVGRLMTPNYVRVRQDWTIDKVLEHIRRYGNNAETINWVFVIDKDSKLIDDIHIREIILAEPGTPISELMDNEYVALYAADDQEEAVRVMNRYDRTALPVVDSLGLLVGIVTADDIADVAEEEFTEDVHKLGGMEALDAPYMSSPVLSMFKKRGGWLAGLFLMQVFTISIMGFFDEQLNKAVVLALFVPMIIASGGNTGTQAASLLVRAIAVEEVTLRSWWKIMRKELLTGLCLGVTLGLLGLLVVWILSHTPMVETPHLVPLATTVGLAVFMIVIWGSLIGSMFPLLLDRVGLDPAASSSPLVATLMDVSGLTIYFVVALALLRGTIL
ncbi:MAG: magnesium transporter [Phycisphaerales bacterium]|nr:magnesium transporter [Phycisphaerales bacterium]